MRVWVMNDVLNFIGWYPSEVRYTHKTVFSTPKTLDPGPYALEYITGTMMTVAPVKSTNPTAQCD